MDTTRYAHRIRWDILESLSAYAERGRPVGGFLEAVLSNDLLGAIGRADDQSRRELADICTFIHMELPGGSYGSRDRMLAWISRGGLRGRVVTDPAGSGV